MTTRLTKLAIDRIDVVDRGANQKAHITLFKRDAPMSDEKRLEAIETEAKETKSLLAKVLDAVKGIKPSDAPDPQAELAKRDQAIADAQAELKKRDEEIAAFKAKESAAVYIAKAKDLAIFGKAEEFGPELQKIAGALGETDFAKFEQRLKGLVEQVKAGKLFEQIGKDGDADADPNAKLEALAKAHQQAHPDVTFEQAYAHVLTTPAGVEIYDAATKER